MELQQLESSVDFTDHLYKWRCDFQSRLIMVIKNALSAIVLWSQIHDFLGLFESAALYTTVYYSLKSFYWALFSFKLVYNITPQVSGNINMCNIKH